MKTAHLFKFLNVFDYECKLTLKIEVMDITDQFTINI